MKVWNVWLVFVTFMLCILGTLLTRSGVVSSVHAFAQSSIGTWFTCFLVFILISCVLAFWKNRDYLRSDNQLDSLVSRESSFLFNNLILLAGCFAVLWGTLFPVISEWVEGTKISVGGPFFNKVTIPIALFLLFLTGVGPLLAWRKTSYDSLKRNFAWPMAGGIAAGVIALVFGLRYIYPLVCLILSVFVTLTIAAEFWRGARVISARSGTNIFASTGQLVMRNTRRYGGYIVHSVSYTHLDVYKRQVVECLVFSEPFVRLEAVLKTAVPLLVKGRVAVEDAGTRLRIMDAKPLEEMLGRSPTLLRVRVDLSAADESLLERLDLLMASRPGRCKVEFGLVGGDGSEAVLESDRLVRADAELLDQIRVICGADSVVT